MPGALLLQGELDAGALERAAREAGGTDIERFGDYHGTPYDEQASEDIILVGRKT